MFGTLLLYNGILLVSTFFIYLSEKERTAIGRALCTTIAFFIVFLPAAFRYELGIDYLSYRKIYTKIGLGIPDSREFGYIFFNRIFNTLGLEIEWFFGFVAFFIFFFVFLSYTKKEHKSIFHFIFIAVFYFHSFNLLRSIMAMSLILPFLFHYKQTGKVFLYTIAVLIGTTLHKSSILLLLIPLLNNKVNYNIIKNTSIIFIFIFIFIYIKGDMLSDFILNSKATELLGYDKYTRNSYFTSELKVTSGLGVIGRALTLLIPIFFIRKILRNDPSDILYIIIIIMCLIAILMSFHTNIFTRIDRMFAIAYVLSPYLIIKTPTIKFRRIITFLIALFWFISYNATIINGSTDHYVTCKGARISPYVSIFNKEDSKRTNISESRQKCEAYFNHAK